MPRHGSYTSLCHLRDGRLDHCHVGDSRIYQIRDGEIIQLTQDHTHVGWPAKRGNSMSAGRNHPGRNALQAVLGENSPQTRNRYPIRVR